MKRIKLYSIFFVLIFLFSSAMADCLFCNIVAGKEPARIIAQNKYVSVFQSNRPRHKTHCLIIPHQHFENLKEAYADNNILAKLMEATAKLGLQLDGTRSFNVYINEGASAGQTIFHVHLHFTSNNNLQTAEI